MLARMNGFRVTILVLFCLTVGLMFYAVTVVIPGRQEQFELYRTMQKSNEYQQRNAEHRARMEQLGPDVEAPEVSDARSAAEESERQRRQELNEAEESSVLAAARRKEEERAAREAAERAAEEAAAPAKLGQVASYSAEWSSILFTPSSATPMNDGLAIAVMRGKQLVCEAVVDGRDEESGQVSATVKPLVMKNYGGAAIQQLTPAPGDVVILSPFAAAADALSAQSRATEGFSLPSAAPAPEGNAAPAADTPSGEIPALEPLPAEVEQSTADNGAPAAPADAAPTPAADMPVQTAPLPSFPTTENKTGLPEVEAQLVPIP